MRARRRDPRRRSPPTVAAPKKNDGARLLGLAPSSFARVSTYRIFFAVTLTVVPGVLERART